jgi:hypothetical protein
MTTTAFDPRAMKIVYNYFLDQCGNRRSAIEEFNKLRSMLNKPETYKLISFGNTAFLLILQDGEIEFHSMGRETSAFAFTKNLYRLRDYLKELNVHKVSTYSNDKIFQCVRDRMKLDIKQELKVGPDGQLYNYYRLEF